MYPGVVIAIVGFAIFTPSVPAEVSTREDLMKKAREIEGYLSEGKRESAIVALQEALSMGIEVPEFNYNIAVVRAFLGMEYAKRPELLMQLRDAVSFWPGLLGFGTIGGSIQVSGVLILSRLLHLMADW